MLGDTRLELVCAGEIQQCGASQTYGATHCGKWKQRRGFRDEHPERELDRHSIAPCNSGCTWGTPASHFNKEGLNLIFVDRDTGRWDKNVFPDMRSYRDHARSERGMRDKAIASEVCSAIMPMLAKYDHRHKTQAGLQFLEGSPPEISDPEKRLHHYESAMARIHQALELR